MSSSVANLILVFLSSYISGNFATLTIQPGQSVSFECNIDYDAILEPILEAANKTLSIQSTFSRNLEDQDKTIDDLKINVERLPDVIGQIVDPIIQASNQALSAQSALAREFDNYKKAVTIEKLTEVIQATFSQDIQEQKKSLTDLITNIQQLPENVRQFLDPILQIVNKISSDQVNLAGNIQGLKDAQDNLATNLDDQKKTVGNLVATVNTLANSLKPMINQHMEAANMTMTQQAAFVSNLEEHEDDLDNLVKTVEKLTKMTNVLFYLVCGLGAVTLMFFAVFIYTRCSNTRPQSGY